jgi:hypothetical protein
MTSTTTGLRPDPARTTPAAPRDLRRLWRTALAVLAPVPGLALTAQILLSPYPVDAPFPQVLAGVAADPARQQLAGWAGLVFSLTVLAGVFAVTWAARRGAPWLALGGGLLAWVGFAVGFSVPGSGAAALVAAQETLDPVKVTALRDAVFAQPLVSVALVVFLVGSSLGLLLLGIALWRSRSGPRVLAVLLALSGPAHLLQPFGTTGAAGSWLLTAVGMAGASIALLRMRDSDFDLEPGTARSVTSRPHRGPDARTVWRVLLAVTAPLVAVEVALGRFLLPYDMGDAPHVIFDTMVASPGFERVSAWVGVALAPACVSGVLAVAWVSRRRAPVRTTVGLLLAYVGFLCLALGNSFGDLIAQVVARHPDLDRVTAYALGYGLESSAESSLRGMLFVFGHLIGTVVLGIALWRSHVLPSWIAIALAASQPVHLLSVMLDNRPLDLLGWGSTALGFAAAGWVLLRSTDDDMDLPPLGREVG